MLRFRPDRLREIRTVLGLSRAEFARRLGVTRQMITFYEDGRYVPGTEVLMQLLAITGAKMDSFFIDESARPSGTPAKKDR